MLWYSALCDDYVVLWYSALCDDYIVLWYSALCDDYVVLWYSALCDDYVALCSALCGGCIVSCLVLIMWHCCVVPFVDYAALWMQYHVLTVAVLLPICWVSFVWCMQGGVVASCDDRCVSVVALVLCLSTVGCCQEAPHTEGGWGQRREWCGWSGWGWCGRDNYRINRHLSTGNGQYSRLVVLAATIFLFLWVLHFRMCIGFIYAFLSSVWLGLICTCWVLELAKYSHYNTPLELQYFILHMPTSCQLRLASIKGHLFFCAFLGQYVSLLNTVSLLLYFSPGTLHLLLYFWPWNTSNCTFPKAWLNKGHIGCNIIL